MNYSKRGIRAKQKAVHATSTRLGKKLLVTVLNLSLLFVLSAGVIGVSMGFGIFKGVIDTAPSIENIKVTPTGFSTFVYDLEGNQTAKLVSQNSNRIPVTWDMIPQDLADAFVAVEDARFYEHNGIDIKGIIRAAYIGVVVNKFHFTEGASTITQQLLKNNVFTDWTNETGFADKMKRKIQEQYLAIELSKSMSKEDVLLNYMNSINLGQNTLGVQAASLRYFNKSVNTLNLSECAVIAGITQNPSRYNPISHPEDNAKRRKKVLGDMLEQEYISQTEYEEAMADDVYSRIQVVNESSEDSTVNTYFVDSLTNDVMDDLLAAGYNETQAFTLLYSGGLKIYSTQDPNIQAICDEVFSNDENYPADTRWQLSYALTIKKASGDYENHSTEMFRTYFKEQNPSFNLIFNSHEEAYAQIEEYKQAVLESGDEVFDESITLTPQPQVSITVEDQHTGYVLAMVGGRGPKEASRTLNRATDSVRQPGSTFKPIAVYAPAFDSAGLTLATVINDAPFNYADGRPVNNWWGSSYRGLNSLRQGIIESMNILAVKTLTIITPQLGFDYVKNFGFTTVVDRKEVTVNGETQIFSDIQQSLGLGGLTDGVTNEELNAAYAAIANGGTYIKPKLYTKVVDHDGNVILDNTQPDSRQVIKETTAWLLTSAMMDVVIQGTGASCNFGNMAIAGKTGTTSAYNDVWFAGYTPYYTATTWTGYDNNTKLRKGEERSLAKKLWRAVMSKIHEGLPSASFPMPSSGIVQATVCARSGKLPIAGLCDGTLKTEYFAEGTVPTESCDVHFRGMLCQYCGLPASEGCPFAVEGVRELLPIEHPSLQQGSAQMQQITNEDGTVSTVPLDPNQTNTCPHNAEFMAQPGIEGIIEQQRNEILAAQQAAIAAAEGGGAPPAENTAPPDDSNGTPAE
ncbi:MAG: transglycosylase domain-containing protein [Lachnospiraceae bacterium]|nr:transglycosylase domain-containing protein [Lachnospiraceae bacterium]